MALVHFCKRLYECIFVHYFSKASKSLNLLIWEMAYYWLFFGLVVPFYLFHPYYQEKFWSLLIHEEWHNSLYTIFFCGFIFSEIMNFFCHVHLKMFRTKDLDPSRGIPRLHGFNYVSCANYFWEFLAWCCFALITQSLASTAFLFVSFFRMNYRA